VVILIRESAGIKFTPLTDLTAPDDKCADIIQAKLNWKGHELVVTNLYNPPVSSRTKNRQGFSADYTLSACARQGANLVIGGDFNAHVVLWNLAEDVVESEEGAEVEEWLRENDATLGNSGEPTLRHSTTGRRSAVDLPIYISSWRTILTLGFSDHVTIEFNVGWENLNATGEVVCQMTAAEEKKFCCAKANWERFD